MKLIGKEKKERKKTKQKEKVEIIVKTRKALNVSVFSISCSFIFFFSIERRKKRLEKTENVFCSGYYMPIIGLSTTVYAYFVLSIGRRVSAKISEKLNTLDFFA